MIATDFDYPTAVGYLRGEIETELVSVHHAIVAMDGRLLTPVTSRALDALYERRDSLAGVLGNMRLLFPDVTPTLVPRI